MPTIKYKDPITGEYKSDIHVVGAVSSVNGKTGVVEIDNSDIPNAITDVQVNGTSVVTDGVANVPKAGAGMQAGVVAYNNYYGLEKLNDNPLIGVQKALDADITNRNQNYRPIVPNNLDYAVKAAMCDGRGAAWTPAEQAAARERMGAERRKTFELIEEITLTEDTASILRSSEPNGTPYDFESVVVEIDQTNATTKQQLNGWVRINNDKPIRDWVYAANFSGDSSAHYYCIFYKLTADGSVESGAFKAASKNNTGALSQQINTIPSNIFRATRVSYLNIYNVNPFLFGAGTVIKIHGVRA